MKITITPKTDAGNKGLSEYIVDNQTLTGLVKGAGFITNTRKISLILRKWKINYAQYAGTRKLVEKYSSQDGSLNPPLLSIDLFAGQSDSKTQDKYLKDLLKVIQDCYGVSADDLNIEFLGDV